MSLINDALKRASKAVKKQGSHTAEGAPMEPVENAEAQSPESSPEPPPIEPASAEPSDEGDGGGKKKLILVVLLILVLGGAGYFFFQAYRSKKSATVAAGGTNAAAKGTNAVAKGSTNADGAKVAKATPGKTNILVRQIQTASAVADKVSAQNREGEKAANSIQPSTPPPTTTQAPSTAPSPAAAQGSAPSPAPATATPSQTTLAQTPSAPAQPQINPNADFPAVLKLSAIYFRLKGASAVINGDTLHVGDLVDNVARVTKIDRDQVILTIGLREKILTLK